jgi:predicted nucleic acid-binding protein
LRRCANGEDISRLIGLHEVADAWVAATAILYDATLVTNNPGDYVGVAGIKLLPNE